MPKKHSDDYFPEDLQKLAEELDTLKELIQNHTPAGSSGSAGEAIALTRLCHGISQEEWQKIAQIHGLNDWLALSMADSSCMNIKHLQRSLTELRHLTEHDPMTGLANRRSFERKLEVELQRVERSKGQVSLAIIDIDHFKKVNDTYGHPCGDEVLIELAHTLNTSRRAYDVAARMGGEEFALILPGATPLKAKAVVERLLAKFRDTQFTCVAGEPFSCTFSAGIAALKGRNTSQAATLIELADKALYEAKEHGRNRVHVARLKVEQEIDRTTMVHSKEKQFLFAEPE